LKKTLILIPFVLQAGILSSLQEQNLKIQKKESIQQSIQTEKSWINPIILQYTVSKTNSVKPNTQITDTFVVSINQPIFKSGAIYYSIKYAAMLKKYNLENLKLQRKTLIKNAYSLAIDYKINQLQKKIILLQIKNAKIDIKRKKEEYQNGTLDINFLNDALLSLNNLRLSLEDLEYSNQDIVYAFKNISDMDIKNVNVKLFKIIPKEEYIKNNLKLKLDRQQKRIKYDLYKMQVGNTLFSIFLNASLTYQKTHFTDQSLAFQDSKMNFYNIGFGVSLPLDISANNKIEAAKLQYLKSNIDILQTKRELINTYQKILKQIKYLNDKINIYKDNIKIYNSLIASTKDSIKAGNATLDDLKILQNSQQTNFLNIKILKLQIQKLLLDLYYTTTFFGNFS